MYFILKNVSYLAVNPIYSNQGINFRVKWRKASFAESDFYLRNFIQLYIVLSHNKSQRSQFFLSFFKQNALNREKVLNKDVLRLNVFVHSWYFDKHVHE